MPLVGEDILQQQSNQIFDPTKGNFVVYPSVPKLPPPPVDGGEQTTIGSIDSQNSNTANKFLQLSDNSNKEQKVTSDTSFKFKPEDVDRSGRFNRWVFGVDNENLQHQLQSGWDRFGNWGTNLVTKVGAYAAQNTGFLLGAPTALASGDISDMTDNFLTKMGDNMKDWVQNKFPIYKGDKYTKGNIWDKLGTMDWWLDDATDRLALTASMFLPGAAEERGFGLAALAEKGLKAIADSPESYGFLGKTFLPKLYKAASEGVADESVLPALGSYGKSLRKAELMGWNVIGQSGLNAMETQQGITKYLNEQRDKGLNTLTDEDIKTKAAQGALRSFWETVPITLAGSAVEIPMMFQGMRAAKSTLNKIFNPETGELLTKGLEAEVPSIPKTLFKAALTGLEHGQNESMQVAISRYNEESLTGRDTKGTIKGIFGDFLDNINDPNGQNNIALGTIQGILMTLGGVAGARFTKAGRENRAAQEGVKQTVYDVINRAKLQRRYIRGDFNQRDENNNLVIENGNVKLDPAKVADAGLSLDGIQRAMGVRIAAIKAGDTKTLDALNHESLSALSYNFFGDPNGMEHLKGILTLEAKEAKQRNSLNDVDEHGVELTPDVQLSRNIQTVEKLKRAYDAIDERHAGILDLDAKDDQRAIAQHFLGGLKWAQYLEASNQQFLTDKIARTESALSNMRIMEGIDVDSELKHIDRPSNPSEQKYNTLIDDLQELKDSYESSKDVYKTLVNKNLIKGAFKDNVEFATGIIKMASQGLVPIKTSFEATNSEGKSRTLDVGKEYPTTEPFLRDGNKLFPSPKLTILAPAFGGRFNVRLPNGDTTTLSKSQIADYNLSEVPFDDRKIGGIMDKAVDDTLSLEKYKDIPKPSEGQNKLDYVNSLDNKDLIDDVSERASKGIADYRAAREKADVELAKLKENKKAADKIQKGQADTSVNTGNFDDVNVEIKDEQTHDEGMIKPTLVVYRSTTSASEKVRPDNTVSNRVVRERNFLYNQTQFPDAVRTTLKALIVTSNSEESLGLKGLIADMHKEDRKASEYLVDNVDRGIVAVVYASDRNGYMHFVDKDGKLLGEAGKTPYSKIKDQLIVSTLPTTATTNTNTKGEIVSRFRAEDKDKAEAYAADWKKKREFILSKKDYTPSDFSVSRGIPVYDSYEEDGVTKYRENSPANSLFDKTKGKQFLVNQRVIEVAKEENIPHQGINYKTKLGRVYYKYNDRFAPLNNRKFTEEEQKTLYKVLHQFSKEKGQADRLANYLRNVLYYSNSEGKTIGKNQVWIDRDLQLHLGQTLIVPFTPISIEENEIAIKGFLSSVYNNTNSQTLEKKFSEPFEEILDISDDGKYVTRQWPNYQSFLLSDEFDGKPRNSYLKTPIRQIVNEVVEGKTSQDRNFQQKYAILQELEYKAKEVIDFKKEETPKTEEVKPPETVEKFTTSQGWKITFTRRKDGTLDVKKEGDYQKAIDALSTHPSVQERIKEGVEGGLNEKEAKELAAKTFLENAIKAKLSIPTPKAEEPKNEKPKNLSAPKDEESEYRAAPNFQVERMSELEKKEFAKFVKEKLPQFTVEEVTQILKTANNRSAWGKLQGNVISLYKAAEKGTGYHEAFEAVWKYFVNPAQQSAIYSEVQARKGEFTDRVSGEKVVYKDATESQIKEKLADEFADFKVGKKLSIGRLIREAFERIINFFRAFLRGYKENKSLVDQLFNRIEKGEFKGYNLPNYIDKSQEFSVVPHLTVAQTHGYVQDITARMLFELLREKADLFDFETYNRKDIFNTIKSQYQGVISEMPEGEKTFTQLVQKVKEHLATYRVQFDENNVISINDDSADRISYNSSEEKMKLDVKKSQPFAIKLLIGTLYKTIANTDADGNIIGAPLRDGSGAIKDGYQLLSPSRTTITLLEALAGATSPDDMIVRLKKLSNENTDYVKLINRLGKQVGNTISWSELDDNQWRIASAFYDSFNKQKPEVRGIVYGEEGEAYFQPMDAGSSQRQIFNKWENNIKITARSGKSVFEPYDRKLKAYKVNKDKLAEYKKNVTKGGNNTDAQLEFLNDLGVNIDRSIYNRLTGDEKDSITRATNKIFQYLNSKGGLKIVDARAVGIDGPLSTISTVYSRALKPDAESTFQNGDGEQQQSYIQHNYVSYFENVFNGVGSLGELKERMPNLKDVYSTNSEILKLGGKFFDEDGNRTKAELKLGYINASESDGRTRVLKDVEFPENIRTRINSILNGMTYISVPADGSTEWYLRMDGFIGYNELLSGDNTKINNKMYDYLLDEIALAKEDRSNIKNVGNKSNELRFFKDILSKDNVERVNRIINEGAPIESINRDSLNNDFQLYIAGEVAKLKKTLSDENETYALKDGDKNTIGWDTLLDSYIDKYNLPIDKSFSDTQFNTILKNVIINDFIYNTELHKVLFGDPYNFKVKEDSLDEVKRIKSFLSPAKNSFISTEYNNKYGREWATTGTITDYIPKNTIVSSTMKSVEIDGILPGYQKTDEADSQAWHSILFHRDLLNRHYSWGKDAQKWMDWELAYTRLALDKKGISIGEYTDEQKIADKALTSKPKPEYKIDVIKPIVRGMKDGKEYNDLLLDKISSAPIWYSAVEGTTLENVFIKMLKEKRDYIVMESGRKVGAEELHSLYNPDGSFNTLPFNNKIEASWEGYAIQVENRYSEGGRQTRGSQITKLFSLDFFDEGKPSDYNGEKDWDSLTPEEKEKASEMEQKKNENNKILNSLTEDGYSRLLNKLGLVDKNTHFEVADREKLMSTLRKETFNRDMPDNLRDVFKPNPKTGKYDIPIEATSEYTNVQKMLYSMADKLILSPSHNGGGMVQLSPLGWENAKEGRKLVIKNEDGSYRNVSREEYKGLSDEDRIKVRFTSSALKFYTTEDPYTEILLPNFIRKRLDPKDERTDEEILKHLNSTKEGRKILEGIGFRIPTQGMNQVEAFRVKGFLAPEFGNTVVVPSEIVTKSGSDFDIDKLNTYLKNTYTDSEGNIKEIPFFGHGEEGRAKAGEFLKQQILTDFLLTIEDEKTEDEAFAGLDFKKDEEDAKRKLDNLYTQSLENAYIDNLKWFITHPSNFNKLTQPTEGGPLKTIAKEIDKLTGQSSDNKLTNLVSINYLAKLRQQFTSTKKWMGIVVNAITSHAQAQRTKLYIDTQNTPLSKNDKDILGDGKILLKHNTTTVNGRTLPTLSKRTDVDGNDISDSLSWYTTAIVDVAKDPYIASIIHNKKLVPTLTMMIRLGIPPKTTALFLNQPIIREYLKYSDRIGFSKLASTYRMKEFLKLGYFPNSKGEADLDVEEFPDCIEGFYKSDKAYGERLTQQQNRYQNLVLSEFLKYFKMSEHLFNFTQSTNWDTADLKTGGAVFKKQLRTKRENRLNMFKTPGKILNSTGLYTIAKIMDNVRKAVSSMSKFESPLVRSQLDEALAPHTAMESFQWPSDFEKIDGQLTSSFIDYLIQTEGGQNKNISHVITNESTATARKIKEIQGDPEKLKELNNNPIFQNLSAQITSLDEGANNVYLTPFPKASYDKDLITGYIREIKELNPELYRSIVRLALIQGVGKFNNLLPYIPNEDYAKILEPLIQGNLEEKARNYKENHNFERANWRDDTIVPEATRLKMYKSIYGINTSRLHAPIEGVIKLVNTYNATLVDHPIIKVRKTIPIVGTGSRYDVTTKKEVTANEIKQMKEENDFSFLDYVGYQKVMKSDGTPLTTTDKKGDVTYYYKQVNLTGTRDLAEHYTDQRASLIDNQTFKIEKPLTDSQVERAINPPPPLSSPAPTKTTPVKNELLSLSEPMDYKMPKVENIFGRDTSTIDEIISGNRTSTTRGYWHNIVKKGVKPEEMVGKVINFKDKSGKSVDVKVTSIHKITKEDRENPEFLKQWSESEGWTKEHLLKATKVGEYQVKFEKEPTMEEWYAHQQNINRSQELSPEEGTEGIC